MSMLAEPRRKQKWSVDPRNSAWSKDESKFGQKMLERMGWSKGKGLGRSEQGSTDHIKVKVKNNQLGLGVSGNHEDDWIAHQDDFNQLLADLNNCHGKNDVNEPISKEKQTFSLEEKSKTSKKRVHYMKFTKGKDLSSRSETDLACIFGKRAKHSEEQKEERCGSDCPGEKEEAGECVPQDVEAITKTVTSTLTMQEYFAQRMADLKGAPGTVSSRESGHSSMNHDGMHDLAENSEAPPRKKQKRKRRAMEVVPDEAPHAPEESVEQPQAPVEKKRKKGKRAEKGEGMTVDCSNTCGQKQDCEEKAQRPDAELVNCNEPTQSVTVVPERIKKKKKKSRGEKSEEQTMEVLLEEKKLKKEKKERRND